MRQTSKQRTVNCSTSKLSSASSFFTKCLTLQRKLMTTYSSWTTSRSSPVCYENSGQPCARLNIRPHHMLYELTQYSFTTRPTYNIRIISLWTNCGTEVQPLSAFNKQRNIQAIRLKKLQTVQFGWISMACTWIFSPSFLLNNGISSITFEKYTCISYSTIVWLPLWRWTDPY